VLSIDEAHQRFGDPMVRHPLHVNFPSPTGEVPKIGANFDQVAKSTGMSDREITTLRKTGSFEPRRKLAHFVASTVLKIRQNNPFQKRH
jgi:hypothetical protein